MPKMAGLDSLWEINLRPALRRIPIVILTASEASPDISDSYNLGAYAYLVKPVTFAKLHEAVLRLRTCRYELTVPGDAGGAERPAVVVMADDDPEGLPAGDQDAAGHRPRQSADLRDQRRRAAGQAARPPCPR